MFSKAPTNAAHFSALFAIMHCILEHLGTTSPRFDEPPKISPVDGRSGIGVFRYCWKIQKFVVEKVILLSPMTKCTPFHRHQFSLETSIQWAEKKI